MLGLLVQFTTTTAWAQSNSKILNETIVTLPLSQETSPIVQVNGQFETHQNKIGRVAITNVAPLSLKRVSQNSQDIFLGISFLTQEDVVVSAGVGAGFTF